MRPPPADTTDGWVTEVQRRPWPEGLVSCLVMAVLVACVLGWGLVVALLHLFAAP
jgi:uncharacterized membrane protein YdfJ with MMPL/SSD domain